ncbi:hypothetical protein M408DRAFT_29727, partial [Serendipita vermifera MAFF 305830]
MSALRARVGENKSAKTRPSDHTSRLVILADTLMKRFDESHNEEDLKRAISYYQKAVDFTPDHHSDKPSYLTLLGDAFMLCFEHFGDPDHLDQAISNQEKALTLTPNEHPSSFSPENILAEIKNGASLDDVISKLQKSSGFSDGSNVALLINCGMELQKRFERLGNPKDLESAISILQRANDLTAQDHKNKPLCLCSLGGALLARFGYLGNPEDLQNAITKLRESVKVVKDGDPSKPTFFNTLGRALLADFEHCNKHADINTAISNLETAVNITPKDDPKRLHYLHDYGNALRVRFERLGRPEDLEKSISVLLEASKLEPDDHPDIPSHLNSLGAALMARFDHFGDDASLQTAISALQHAETRMPDGHTIKPSVLHNVGKALWARCVRNSRLEDLNVAILSLRKAIELTPNDPSSSMEYLLDFVVKVQERFERFGSPADLNSLISTLQTIVILMQASNSVDPIYLNALGKALKTRYENLGNPEDLDRSILNLYDSVVLTGDDDPYKAHRLNNLGSAFSLPSSQRDRVEDMHNAIACQNKAVKLTPTSHPNKPNFLTSLGDTLSIGSIILNAPGLLKKAIEAFIEAARSSVGHPKKRFDAALKWAQCCQDASESPISAYTCAINLLPLVAPLGSKITDQHAVLAKVGGIARDAVAAAIVQNKHIMALEWAEQGRSIVWQNLLSLRAPLHDLRRNHPELAHRLQEISEKMEKPYGDAVIGSKEVAQPTEDVARMHSALALDWQNTLKEVRKQLHFESFLMPKTFNTLHDAARDGPVVILNVQDSRCDALVLIKRESGLTVNNIPLEGFSYQTAQELLETMKSVLSSAGVGARGTRGHDEDDYDADGRDGLERVLSTLWLDVVKPVIKGLRYPVGLADPPHIWWCPTGPLAFLPIHAAGLYNTDTPGEKVSDYAISSYTPTLTSILSQDRDLGEDFRLLTVALPSIS